jgi:hypothetical protein
MSSVDSRYSDKYGLDGPGRVASSLPSTEEGNRSGFRNVVVSSYLEVQATDKLHKPSDSERRAKRRIVSAKLIIM